MGRECRVDVCQVRVRDAVRRVIEVEVRVKVGLLSVLMCLLLRHKIQVKGKCMLDSLNLLVDHKAALVIPAVVLPSLLLHGLPRPCLFA